MKSDTIKTLSMYAEARYEEPDVTTLLIDGAVLIQTAAPREYTICGEYYRKEFTFQLLAIIKRSCVCRMDIVFDVVEKDITYVGLEPVLNYVGRARALCL